MDWTRCVLCSLAFGLIPVCKSQGARKTAPVAGHGDAATQLRSVPPNVSPATPHRASLAVVPPQSAARGSESKAPVALTSPAHTQESRLSSCGRGSPPEPTWSERLAQAPLLEGRLIGVRGALTSYRSVPELGLNCAGGKCPAQQSYGLAIAANQKTAATSLAIRGFGCSGTGPTPCNSLPLGSEAVAVGRLERSRLSGPRWKLVGASLCVVEHCWDCEPGSWGD